MVSWRSHLPLCKTSHLTPPVMSVTDDACEFRLLALLAAPRLFCLPAAATEPPDRSEVAERLGTHCLDCHSGQAPEGNLDLTRFVKQLRFAIRSRFN